MNNLPSEKPSLAEQIALVIFDLWSCCKLITYFFYDLYRYKFRKRLSLDECQRVMDWVMTQYIPRDSACELLLPPHLAEIIPPLPDDLAEIIPQDIVEVLRTRDNRYCVLVKTYIGWKDNFEGTFYCNKPLSEDELIKIDLDRVYIHIKGQYYPTYYLHHLYVRKSYDDNRRFEVYFDLH